jgi:hypothetical protein
MAHCIQPSKSRQLHRVDICRRHSDDAWPANGVAKIRRSIATAIEKLERQTILAGVFLCSFATTWDICHVSSLCDVLSGCRFFLSFPNHFIVVES